MPLIVGHRGLPREYPDNSLAGILAAAAVCDMIEIDVRATRDRVLVLSHDPVVDGRVLIESSWEEVAALDIGAGYHPTTLDDLLRELGDVPLNIEIKNDPADSDLDSDFDFARAAAARARTGDLVTSFHWPTMTELRDEFSELTMGLLVDPLGSLEAAAGAARQGGFEAVVPHWSLLVPDPGSKLQVLRGDGLEVVAWTVDDGEVAKSLAAGGVAAIITNDPKGIRRAVEES